MTHPDGVLFDLDGTLVDTTYLHATAWTRALREAGHQVDTATVHRAVGMTGDALIPHVVGPHDQADDQSIKDRHSELYRDARDQVVAFSGARELLSRVHEQGSRVVIVTSATEGDIGPLLEVLDCDDLLDVVTDSSDAKESKPSPDLVEAALDKAGLRANRVVFVGDSVWDVESSGRLAIPCVGLECGGTSSHELREAGAAETFHDPLDLLRHFDDSALGRGRRRT
ncbi:MAG TPA: HAD family hydrolase [Pedococcus sp.]|jgi:HAD superfamily hydrolase (TIGR01509 family)